MKNYTKKDYKLTVVAVVIFVTIAITGYVILNLCFTEKIHTFLTPVASAADSPNVAPERNNLVSIPAAPATRGPASLDILERTINRIESFHSLSAEINLDLYLFDETYKGKGTYCELINRNSREVREEFAITNSKVVTPVSSLAWTRFRLEVTMTPIRPKAEGGPDENLLRVVCDSKELWTYTKIQGVETLTQIEIEDLSNALHRLSDSERKTLAASGVTKPCGMSGLPGLGGIVGMLKEIPVNYDFPAPAERTAFNNGSFPVWKVTGTLKSGPAQKYAKQINSYSGEEKAAFEKIVPTNIELFIGRDKPFPYRIRYYNQPEGQPTQKLLFSIDYKTVFENSDEIEEKNFIYGPAPFSYERIYDKYLRRLVPEVEL